MTFTTNSTVVANESINSFSPKAIEGITNSTVLDYVNHMNANDFEAVTDLFAAGGALQPPFQQPIVGKEHVFRYLEAECQNLKIIPDKGLISYQDDELTRMRVIGKVQTPTSSDDFDLNIAWRFSLDADNKISFVGIDLISSPEELASPTH
jgi:Nuclear transport factor 2 (NTF2) domain